MPIRVEAIEMDELVNNIKRDAREFIKEVAIKSGVDLEKEELIGVENILKVDDLERELEESKLAHKNESELKEKAHKKELESKEKAHKKEIEEKEKQIKERAEAIKKLREENKRLKYKPK